VNNKRKKSKFEKGFLALLVAPDVLGITAVIVAGIIYLFLK